MYLSSHAQSCDTVKYRQALAGWSDTSYQAKSPFPGFSGGYINGVNFSGDLQKANYFDLSGSSYGFILGTMIKFGKANSTNSANLSKLVYFKVYSDDNGKPGTLLATTQLALSAIKADVDAKRLTNINFSPAIAMPASKKFYVSVDVSNFKWTVGGSLRDTLWIGGTKNNEVLPNTAWEYESDSSWVAFPDNWTDAQSNPLNINLWIFPRVSSNASSCTVLAVNLLSLKAEKNNNDVTLHWQVSEEKDMKGYVVEKSINRSFDSIAFTPALNSSKASYSVTDKNAFANVSNVEYRLKQIDNDGIIKYSSVIALKNTSLTNVAFANPFIGLLKLHINLATSQTVSVRMYDVQGKLVDEVMNVKYSASNSDIILKNSASLPSGNYFIQLMINDEVYKYKVSKQ